MKLQTRSYLCAGAFLLAAMLMSQISALGVTNGTIIVLTRDHQDISWNGRDGDPCDMWNYKGAGQTSQGDDAISALLGDYGYSVRMLVCAEMWEGLVNPFLSAPPDVNAYLHPVNPLFDCALIVQSGIPQAPWRHPS